MASGSRAFLMASLLALAGAATLHLLVLLGIRGLWPAMIHLTLFGWITAMILTVNYHMMPVFAARDFPYPRLIQLHWLVFTGGVALAVAGLLLGWPATVAAGLLLQSVGAVIFVANTMLLFVRGRRRAHPALPPPIPDQPRVDRIGTQATKGAGLSLPFALLLLLAVQLGWIRGAWVLAAEHLATLGWVMLMIVGVAYHVLPRFSGRGVRGPAWARLQLLFHSAALLLMVPGLGLGWAWLFAPGGLLMTVAVGLFAWTVWPTLHVLRPRPVVLPISLKEQPR
ncbi:MAG: hypothetical protein M5U01_06625 [Ardenticatenaceae bacterium]|nr:hypothetical protein [Ardenticatenaceae bacterium]